MKISGDRHPDLWLIYKESSTYEGITKEGVGWEKVMYDYLLL